MITARAVSKQFPGVLALDRVDFTAHSGQVNALVGENGAGKSTLMKILAGIEQPTSGALEIDGGPVRFESARDATARGVAMIHQELNVLPNLSVVDNIFLGREIVRLGLVDRVAEERRAREILAPLDASIDPRSLCGDLPLGRQQTIEIARALSQHARVLIMDEPTSALSHAEIEALFRAIRDLKAQGVAIVYISHRLEELLEIGDTVTVLRDGRVVAEAAAASINVDWIVEQMTGGISAGHAPPAAANGAPVLAARGLSLEGELRGVTFEIAAGEIVGFYGLLGAGRTPLFESIAGARQPDTGELRLADREISKLSIAQRIAAGIALLPESRQRDALVPALSVRENILLASRTGVFLSPAEEARRAAALAAELRIRAADLEAPISSLSGGNQQKAILARYLLASPRALLLDEPTRGVDVGARAEIYEIIRNCAARGMAVMFASSELEEIKALATRVVVMATGRITASFAAESATEDALVAAAAPLLRREVRGLDARR